jgi:shikimate 5-dehydrogenase
MGYKTFICGSNLERTTKVSRSIGSGIGTIPLQSVTRMKGKVSVLVNATPGSLAKIEGRNETKLSVSEIARFLEPSVGIDLVHSSSWTSFLSSVESRGGDPVSGFEMLVAEVIEAHRLWTGKEPDMESLKRCAIEAYPLLNGD